MNDRPRQTAPETNPDVAARGIAALKAALTPVVAEVAERALSGELGAHLNARFPAEGKAFQAITRVCHEGVRDGWLCSREGGGIRYGRVIKAIDGDGFSVDVVDMKEIAGAHHVHPNGEIDMIMPLDEQAQFDGHGAGWLVYPPGSSHSPTVAGGRALVLYLLPQGAIEFTRQ